MPLNWVGSGTSSQRERMVEPDPDERWAGIVVLEARLLGLVF